MTITIDRAREIVSQAGYHRQTAIDSLVESGATYAEASEAVDKVFEECDNS
jgi:hypothetical protein